MGGCGEGQLSPLHSLLAEVPFCHDLVIMWCQDLERGRWDTLVFLRTIRL